MSTPSAVQETSPSVANHAAEANTTTTTTAPATTGTNDTSSSSTAAAATPGMSLVLWNQPNRFPWLCYCIAENHLDGIGTSIRSRM
jgi:hypothetical protein